MGKLHVVSRSFEVSTDDPGLMVSCPGVLSEGPLPDPATSSHLAQVMLGRLLTMLAQSGDENLKFLATRIDFNELYAR